MWTRVPTIVDGLNVSGDWTITFSDRPVGRISYAPEAPGLGAWTWKTLDAPEISGRAWTEEAALAAIKDASASSTPEVA